MKITTYTSKRTNKRNHLLGRVYIYYTDLKMYFLLVLRAICRGADKALVFLAKHVLFVFVLGLIGMFASMHIFNIQRVTTYNSTNNLLAWLDTIPLYQSNKLAKDDSEATTNNVLYDQSYAEKIKILRQIRMHNTQRVFSANLNKNLNTVLPSASTENKQAIGSGANNNYAQNGAIENANESLRVNSLSPINSRVSAWEKSFRERN